jgi:hypothetical protein
MFSWIDLMIICIVTAIAVSWKEIIGFLKNLKNK